MSKKSIFTKKKKTNAVIYVLVAVAVIGCLSFFIGGKLMNKKNIVVSAANVSKTAETKQETKSEKQEPAKNTDGTIAKQDDNKDAKTDNSQKVDNKQVFVNPFNKDGKKVAYLTFDDGPSANTPQILDTLKKYNIKATFFIIGKMAETHKDFLKREKAEGHAIGNHTYSHDYKYLYSSPKNFLDDLNKGNEVISSILDGYKTTLIRFPGGSFGNNKAVYRQEVEKAGYHHVDWNALNGDAEGTLIPVDKLITRLKETVGNQEHIVVLMHDAPGKTTTVQALPQIIEYLKSQGYEFRTLQ